MLTQNFRPALLFYANAMNQEGGRSMILHLLRRGHNISAARITIRQVRDRQDAKESKMTRQREAGTTVLGIVSSSGKKGPPIWVPAGVKINAPVYQDFAIWDHINACRDRAANMEELKTKVNAAWAAMDPAFIRGSCARFRSRLKHVVAVEGGRIE